MSLISVQSNNYSASIYSSSAATQGTSTNASTNASQSSTSSASSLSDSIVQEFLDYAKETPAQRMFSNWLDSQGITQSQYNAMSETQKNKLQEQYREYMKEHLKDAYGTNGSSSSTASSADATGLNVSVSA